MLQLVLVQGSLQAQAQASQAAQTSPHSYAAASRTTQPSPTAPVARPVPGYGTARSRDSASDRSCPSPSMAMSMSTAPEPQTRTSAEGSFAGSQSSGTHSAAAGMTSHSRREEAGKPLPAQALAGQVLEVRKTRETKKRQLSTGAHPKGFNRQEAHKTITYGLHPVLWQVPPVCAQSPRRSSRTPHFPI